MFLNHLMNSSSDSVLFSLNEDNVSYEDSVVLRGITLQISRGEKVALIGPSGAGKTTLLRALYEQTASASAFIHQHHALVPQLSAFHNVFIGRLDKHSSAYNLLNLIKPQERILKHIRPMLSKLGLEEKTFARVGALSGGQQQRVAVARAIYRGEDVLLADEPISAVDPHQADMVMSMIIESAETVVLSLHAVDFALKFAMRIIGLRDGEVCFDLPTEEVSQTLLRELYEAESVGFDLN